MRNVIVIFIKSYHGTINLKYAYSDNTIPGNTTD